MIAHVVVNPITIRSRRPRVYLLIEVEINSERINLLKIVLKQKLL